MNLLNIKKKAELSINMIVIVAISIIILVVVVYLVIQQMNRGEGAISCPSLGGTCVDYAKCNPGEIVSQEQGVCRSTTQVCCNPMGIRST